jgi:hypothetical protein
MKRLKQAWKRDQLGVLGVGAAVGAFVLWAFPKKCIYGIFPCVEFDFWEDLPTYSSFYSEESPNFSWYWFTDVRLPAIAAVLALSFVLLLLRRR